MTKLIHALLAAGAVTFMACGGGGYETPSPVQPSPVASATPTPAPAPTPTPTPGPALQPTFSSINTQVLQVWCIGCHSGVGRPPDGGLRLDSSAAYGELVNARSIGKPSAVRVVPGDPNSSYLIHKLEGRSDIIGDRMPFGGPSLAQTDVDVIRTSITRGAQNN